MEIREQIRKIINNCYCYQLLSTANVTKLIIKEDLYIYIQQYIREARTIAHKAR
jgi:hypothetical protein